MPKLTQLDKAIAALEAEKQVLELAIAKLKMQQAKAIKKPRAVPQGVPTRSA